MAIAQQHRHLKIDSALGENVLLFRRLNGSERLGRPFEYQLDLASEQIQIDPYAVLGKALTVRLELPDGGERYFNGHVTRFAQDDELERVACYRAELRPWLWFLTRTADCRIFQDKSVPDIVKDVFRDHGFSDFEDALEQDYQPREYTVQYRETDFNFVSRLLEQEGIYYYFRHEQARHVLVLVDSVSAHPVATGYGEVPYFPPQAHQRRERDHIRNWSFLREIQPGMVALDDFDFERPRADLEVRKPMSRPHEASQFPVYDYPGCYLDTALGEQRAQVRLEALQARHEQLVLEGNPHGLGAGHRFRLTDCPRQDLNRDYLVVSAGYRIAEDTYQSGRGAELSFESKLEVLETHQPYRTPQDTPRPLVHGPQTAMVVGPTGEEIYTDQHGRVKCQFHWDRHGNADQDSSCWIRVSHPWAGQQWGAIHIPRIGQEVVVSFLEGDPDRPLITGRVYNGQSPPPFALPAQAVISGCKSDTHKGSGFNQVSMDDTAGRELFYTHAQYDMETEILHDQRNRIANNRSTEVGVDDSETVGNSQTVTVGTDQVVTIGSNSTVQVGANRTTMIGTNDQLTVGASQAVTVGATQTLTVGAAMVVTAGAQISLTAGASSIIITPAGIVISAPMLKLN